MPSSITYKQPSPKAANSCQASSSAQESETKVREVWAHNFKSEFTLLLEMALDFKRRGAGIAIGLSVEFPGFLQQASPSASQLERYAALRENVNLLTPIQIGLALASCDSAQGCAWSFNMRFDLKYDFHMDPSIKSLENVGFRFEKHANEGIDPACVGKWLADSGLVGQHKEGPMWMSYGGAYDLGYLLKVIGNEHLPKELSCFEKAIADVCPSRLDLQTSFDADLLSAFAVASGVNNSGQQHTAGRDAMTILEMYFHVFPTKSRRDELKYLPLLDGPMSALPAEQVAPPAQWATVAKSVAIEVGSCTRHYLPNQDATCSTKTTCDEKNSILVEECASAENGNSAPASLWGMVAKSVAVEAESSAWQHLPVQNKTGSTGTPIRDSNSLRACPPQSRCESSLLGDAPARSIARNKQLSRIPDRCSLPFEQAAPPLLWSKIAREICVEADTIHISGRDLARNVEATPIEVMCSSARSAWVPKNSLQPQQELSPQHPHTENELNQAAPPSLWAAAARGR